MFVVEIAARGRTPSAATRVWVTDVGESKVTMVKGGDGTLLLPPASGYLVVGTADRVAEAADIDGRRSLLEALAHYPSRGPEAFADLVGEFSFVWVRPAHGDVLFVRDHFGLAPLYYRVTGETVSVSDSASALGSSATDLEFVAEFIAVGGICNDRTIFPDVTPVPPGTVMRYRDRQLTRHTFWTPASDQRPAVSSFADAAAAFRGHVRRAVRGQLQPDGRTWAHLSGGLDSSTVVAVAHELTARGDTPHALGGTATFRDALGEGADPRFASVVSSSTRIRNVSVSNDNHWAWKDDGDPPPCTDVPSRNYPHYARFRALHAQVSRRGGTTLLTGVGPDVYLPVTAAHVPDLIWQGHLRQAASELCRWSVATRSSLWRVLARDAIAPLLRPGLRHWGGFGKDATASWLTRRFWRAADMAHRLDTRPVAMRRGRQYDTEVGWMLSLTGGALASTWNVAPAVRMRHPLMDQRLVRFVLGLPASMRTDTYRTKPLLRAAMRGILPESVRLRTTKGSILTAHLCGSFARERRRLAQLLTSPVLGDVGVIEPRELLDAVDRAATGRRQDVGLIYAALALETWLSVRSGRWGRSLPQ